MYGRGRTARIEEGGGEAKWRYDQICLLPPPPSKDAQTDRMNAVLLRGGAECSPAQLDVGETRVPSWCGAPLHVHYADEELVLLCPQPVGDPIAEVCEVILPAPLSRYIYPSPLLVARSDGSSLTVGDFLAVCTRLQATRRAGLTRLGVYDVPTQEKVESDDDEDDDEDLEADNASEGFDEVEEEEWESEEEELPPPPLSCQGIVAPVQGKK